MDISQNQVITRTFKLRRINIKAWVENRTLCKKLRGAKMKFLLKSIIGNTTPKFLLFICDYTELNNPNELIHAVLSIFKKSQGS